MARNRVWIIGLSLFGLFIFCGMLFIFAIFAIFDDTPAISEGSVLDVTLSGSITEYFIQDAFGRGFEGASLQMHDLRKAVSMAKVDDRIAGIYLKVGNLTTGWAKAQEIRALLEDFKKTGKFVIAFLRTFDERSYFVSLVADDIYLQPHAWVELNGLAAEIPFYKDLLNKLGIEPRVDNIGKYKSAGDIYKRTSMSPAHREATESILTEIYEVFFQTVCEVRNIDGAELQRAIDRGVFKASDALELRLVDDLKYESDVKKLINARVHEPGSSESLEGQLQTIAHSRYAQISPEDVGLGGGEKIALIYAIGQIVSGSDGYDPIGGRYMGARSVNHSLNAAKNNSSVKAVVLRVDSPGGSPFASDEIWATIESVREKKPVIISMSDVAASGGYWISMGCDAIVAQPLTLTGSIGVVWMMFDLSGTYEKIGLKWETVKRGKNADILTEKRPLTAEEWQIFRQRNRDIYQVFVQKVADERDKTYAEIDEVAQGRVWTGRQALSVGLLDGLGGLDAALAVAKEKAGLDVSEPTQWLVYPQAQSFLESLMSKISAKLVVGLASKTGDSVILPGLSSEAKTLVKQLTLVDRINKGEFMAIAPLLPDIH